VGAEALEALQQVRQMRTQGPAAVVGIDQNNRPQVLEKGAPSGMVRQNAGMQHFWSGQQELWRRLFNNAALGWRSIAIVDCRRQAVLRWQGNIPGGQRRKLG
jgi:hypothetical protein